MRLPTSARRIFVPVLAITAVLLASAPAAANSIPRTGDRLNLFVPPATAPADTPFWVGHGFATEPPELPAAIADGSAWFELYVDGAAVSLRKDVDFLGGASVESVNIGWFHNFADGLPSGSHHFEGRWYVYGGVLQLQLEADVLFE